MRPDSFHHFKGSALLLVLWSLLLLSMSVFGVVEIVQSSVSHSSHLELESQARTLAMSGLAVAMHPEMRQSNSLLKQQPAAGEKWDVGLHGEAGRLNLNFVLSSHHSEILSRLFVSWGLKQPEADSVTACLYDWITPGDKASPNGAKKADYQRAGLTHFPSGKPFASFAEASLVIGMTAVEKAKPDWQDAFTLWSDGPLDVNEASPELLSAVFSLPPSLTQAFVERRNGNDGISETDDDAPVKDANGLKSALGLGDKSFATISNQVSFADPIRRVQSTGAVNGVAVTLAVVVRLQSSPPEYLLWNEL